MADSTIEYLKDTEGQPSAVVIPIEIWRRIFPEQVGTVDQLSVEEAEAGFEDYCLSKAIDEATQTPILNRDAALTLLTDKLE